MSTGGGWSTQIDGLGRLDHHQGQRRGARFMPGPSPSWPSPAIPTVSLTLSGQNLRPTGDKAAAGLGALAAIKGNVRWAASGPSTAAAAAISASSIGLSWGLVVDDNVLSITTKGDGTGNITAGSIKTFKVGGGMTDAIIHLTDSAGVAAGGDSTVARAMIDSSINSASDITAADHGGEHDQQQRLCRGQHRG